MEGYTHPSTLYYDYSKWLKGRPSGSPSIPICRFLTITIAWAWRSCWDSAMEAGATVGPYSDIERQQLPRWQQPLHGLDLDSKMVEEGHCWALGTPRERESNHQATTGGSGVEPTVILSSSDQHLALQALKMIPYS